MSVSEFLPGLVAGICLVSIAVGLLLMALLAAFDWDE